MTAPIVDMALRDELSAEGIERLTLAEDYFGAGLYIQSVYLVPFAAAYRDDPGGYAKVRREILDCNAPGTWLEPAPIAPPLPADGERVA